MFSYKPLLHTMIEKDITKTQLCQMLGCSKATIAKLTYVRTVRFYFNRIRGCRSYRNATSYTVLL